MRKAALVLAFLLALLAAAGWFLADEELEPATQAWLEAPRAGQDAEGLDFLFLMGLMAPPGADPIKHARDLIRQHEEDFYLRIDYLPDLMAGSPCEIDDWACWDSDDTSWVADTLVDYAHVLDRWYSLPVHHDFGDEALTWFMRLLTPSFELLGALIKLELVSATREQQLDELASRALEQAAQLSTSRALDGNSLSLLVFEVIKQQSVNQMARAIRYGAVLPSQELLDQFKANQLAFDDHLIAWAQREFTLIGSFVQIHSDKFPDNLLARQNRTLNRARACLEQVIELADPAKLFEFMETEAEICGPDWQSWRNWRGDDLVDLYLLGRNNIACRIRELAHRDDLAIALLEALAAEDAETARLAEVARANPYYPERGAFLKEDQICFESLGPGCGETCLPAPWPITPSTE